MKNKRKIKNLALKYVLIDTTQELHQAGNFENDALKENYEKCGVDSVAHYEWLYNVFCNISENMKNNLNQIFNNMHFWTISNNLKNLEDTAGINEILAAFENMNFENSKMKPLVKDFFYFFYTEHLEPYLKINASFFQNKSNRFNTELAENNFDFFSFMQEKSGMRFEKEYNVSFYFLLRAWGSYAFKTEDSLICLISREIKDTATMFLIPFHEFSHILFRQFTSKGKFIKLSKKLTAVPEILSCWEKHKHDYHEPSHFIEENLVDGFSHYLRYFYSNYRRQNPSYYFDIDFFNHLLEIKFDPNKKSLEKVCFDYLRDFKPTLLRCEISI